MYVIAGSMNALAVSAWTIIYGYIHTFTAWRINGISYEGAYTIVRIQPTQRIESNSAAKKITDALVLYVTFEHSLCPLLSLGDHRATTGVDRYVLK